MAPSPPFLLLFLLISAATTTSTTTGDLLSDLTHLQSTSPSGVIPLTTPLLNQILSLPLPRPFHFLIFFDAVQLHSKPELHLPTLKSEFSLLSKSLLINSPPPPPPPLFFFHVEFKNSQDIFALFGVVSLPFIKLVPPSIPRKDLEKGSVKMEASDYSRLSESMSEFIELKAGVSVGVIHRPPLFSKGQLGFVLLMGLVSMPILIKRIGKGDTVLHRKGFWGLGAIFVYFFSVSGAMYNIIRKMPMFVTHRNDPNKMVFFHQGSGMQLGMEGFIVGFLYTVVGLVLALMSHVLVRVNSITVQRFVMLGALFVAFWAVSTVISLDHWKTGYRVYAYWPTSWR